MLMLQAVREIEKRAGRPVHEIFDLVGGTSTGGFLAACLILKRYPLERVEKMYHRIRSQFHQTTLYSAYRTATTGASHDADELDRVMRDMFGDVRLEETATSPKCFFMTAAVNSFPAQPFLLRNYELTPEA